MIRVFLFRCITFSQKKTWAGFFEMMERIHTYPSPVWRSMHHRMMLQASNSRSSGMLSGGAMRSDCSLNKNQSVMTPLSRQSAITALQRSLLPRSTPSMKPLPVIRKTVGWLNRCRISGSKREARAGKCSASKVSITAHAAAAQTGLPPKVVICPRAGRLLGTTYDAHRPQRPQWEVHPPSPWPASPHRALHDAC